MPHTTFTLPLFAPWRAIWARNPTVAETANKADELARERNRLKPPKPEAGIIGLFRQPLRKLCGQEANSSLTDPQEYLQELDTLGPLLAAARWPRWLLLEDALEAANQNSDFLVAALALRTLIEEFRVSARLEELHGTIQRGLEGGDKNKTLAAVSAHAKLLIARLLPRLSPTPFNMPRRIQHDRDLDRILREPQRRLNDYVHPNYGSHVTAVTPEDAEAGSVLLSAFVETYDPFLRLPWISCLPTASNRSGTNRTTTPRHERRLFLEVTVPKIERTIKRFGYPENWTAISPELFRRFFEIIDRAESLNRTPVLDDSVTDLTSLYDLLVPHSAPHSAADLAHFPDRHTNLSFASEDWPLMFSGVRRLAKELDDCVRDVKPEQLFPQKPPYGPWIKLICKSIELTLTIDMLKQNGMRRATIRMLNRGNVLGALLCCRSFIEYYAVGEWLSAELASGWKQVEKAAEEMQDIKPALDAIEGRVASFLAGTKGTAEAPRHWRERWANTAGSVALLTAVDAAFPPESGDMNAAYGHFSRAIHGETLTGGDLLPGSERLQAYVFGQILRTLGQLMEFRAHNPMSVSAIYTLRRFESLANVSTAAEMARQIAASRIPEHLDKGTHFRGAGTIDDPFRFPEHIDYYAATEALCRQLGKQPELWAAWETPEGFGTIVHTSDNAVLYFAPSGFMLPDLDRRR